MEREYELALMMFETDDWFLEQIRLAEIEFCLEQIDAWQSGAKATPGSPSSGERYALRMREEVKRLDKRLEELRKK